MDKLIWFYTNAASVDVIGPVALPILVGLLLYQSHYPWVLARFLYASFRGRSQPRLALEERHTVLLVIPSLLRNRGDLDGIRRAMIGAAANGYPGSLVVCAAVDGHEAAPSLSAELRAFARAHPRPPGVHLVVVGTPGRNGKAFAVDHAVHEVRALSERGELPIARVFFNMDADCEPSEGALERMVVELTRRSWLSRERGLLVTGHVSIRRRDYWKGWRHFFTVAGQLEVSVAREYLVALGLGRHNGFRILPRVAASGALYCTWIEVLHEASRYAGFMQSLRLRDWLAWWIGAPPPRFSTSRAAPKPHAIPGMGDDTFTSWIALSGTWRGDRLSFDFPRTPIHALLRGVKHYFSRTCRYDPHAKIYTTTPTSVRALFKQRVRWNVSRIWTLQRFLPSMVYHLQIGIPAMMDVALAIVFQSVIMVGLLITPFTKMPAMWLAMLLLVEGTYLLERVLSTLLGLTIDGGLKRDWPKLLALPQAGLYLFVFNIVTTVVGFVRQVLGFGLNTGFTPEHTLVAGGTTRIALTYRLTRFVRLCLRSVLYGDVPFGAFWLGWSATPWTPNGYEGWTTGRRARVPIVPPRPALADLPAPALARVAPRAPRPREPLSALPHPPAVPFDEYGSMRESAP